MLQSLVTRSWQVGRLRYVSLQRIRQSSTIGVQQQDEPLRILFCGSESFSITALQALHEYQKDPASKILSIDVATRCDKRGGRGMKELRSPQIKAAAARLKLRLHQFDTFTGWHLPEYGASPQPYINLIVAVSFGLLIPPRILSAAKFGGLNVHPSMLPDLRGAAPINWTIMKGHTHTGVTVQTLHPSKFDHGTILAQTPQPGIAIPDPGHVTAHELRIHLAPVGADMLVNAIRNRLYLQPYREISPSSPNSSASSITLAPKIVSSMKFLDPYQDDLSTILRKNRAIPRLWSEVSTYTNTKQKTTRIIFGPRLSATAKDDLPVDETTKIVDHIATGTPFTLLPSAEDPGQSQRALYLKVKGGFLTIPDLLVAGQSERPAAGAAARAKLFSDPVSIGNKKLYVFRQPLARSNGDI